MAFESSIIETGVDRLVNIVKSRGRIALADAAKQLGVSINVVQEWVDFLEDEGIISVEYKLTVPYLVERKLTKKELEEKAKEFKSKRDVFIRKAEVNLSFLEKQAEDLKKVKGEFDKLKNDLGLQLDAVRDDLKELERYQQLRLELQKQVEDQKTESRIKIEELTNSIAREQKKYQQLISDVKKEREVLQNERQEAKSIEESEKILNKKLEELKQVIGLIDKKVLEEGTAIKNSEVHIERLNKLMDEVKQNAEQEKSIIEPLIEKSREQGKKVLELQDKIMKKIAKKQKDTSDINSITRKVKDFFDKKLAVIDLVDRVNKDRDDLEKSLIELIKTAKSFQLSAKSGDIGKEMKDLEKKFNEVNKKKGIFEEEIKKFTSFFRH